MGKALSGELSCPCDRSCFAWDSCFFCFFFNFNFLTFNFLNFNLYYETHTFGSPELKVPGELIG